MSWLVTIRVLDIARYSRPQISRRYYKAASLWVSASRADAYHTAGERPVFLMGLSKSGPQGEAALSKIRVKDRQRQGVIKVD